MGQKARQKPDIPLLEWVAAALGMLLVGGTMGYLAWTGWHSEESPPDIALTVGDVQSLQSGYVVTLRARNNGGSTAADVKVEGELRRGGTVAETSEVTFRYLPQRSTREGGMFFRNDPRAYELVLTAKGYEKP